MTSLTRRDALKSVGRACLFPLLPIQNLLKEKEKEYELRWTAFVTDRPSTWEHPNYWFNGNNPGAIHTGTLDSIVKQYNQHHFNEIKFDSEYLWLGCMINELNKYSYDRGDRMIVPIYYVGQGSYEENVVACKQQFDILIEYVRKEGI